MDSWRGSKVVVTGGSGFLGGHLVERLRSEGAQVLAPSSAECDLLDPSAARKLLSDRPDVVFHLAARVGGIGANRERPGTFFRDTLFMGMHVLDAAREHGVGKLVQVGTVCSYPKHTPVPFREENLWSGFPEETNAPYGIAKRALIVGSQAYEKEFGLRSVNVLLLNLFGERDNFDPRTSHVIPALIRKTLDAVETGADFVEVWGDGTATRGFLYVKDAIEGLLGVAHQVDTPDPINLGAPGEVSIRGLTGLIGEICGFEGTFKWDPSKPNGQPRRALDCSLAEQLFGFHAKTSLSVGLRRTIEWYRAERERNALLPGKEDSSPTTAVS